MFGYIEIPRLVDINRMTSRHEISFQVRSIKGLGCFEGRNPDRVCSSVAEPIGRRLSIPTFYQVRPFRFKKSTIHSDQRLMNVSIGLRDPHGKFTKARFDEGDYTSNVIGCSQSRRRVKTTHNIPFNAFRPLPLQEFQTHIPNLRRIGTQRGRTSVDVRTIAQTNLADLIVIGRNHDLVKATGIQGSSYCV